MIQHVFDPAMNMAAVSVRADPGVIIIGVTNFQDPNDVQGFELSPIQAALLVLALTNAIEVELDFFQTITDTCGGPNKRGFLG